MSGFNPGPGWRLVGYSQADQAELIYYGKAGVDRREDGEPQSMWIKEDQA